MIWLRISDLVSLVSSCYNDSTFDNVSLMLISFCARGGSVLMGRPPLPDINNSPVRVTAFNAGIIIEDTFVPEDHLYS